MSKTCAWGFVRVLLPALWGGYKAQLRGTRYLSDAGLTAFEVTDTSSTLPDKQGRSYGALPQAFAWLFWDRK